MESPQTSHPSENHASENGTPKPTHPLDRRQIPEQRGYKNLSPEWETRAAISAILEITLTNQSFKAQLDQILDVIVSISWLRAAKQGAVFVANARNELVLVVEHSLARELIELCAKVPFGHCLCGKAAQERKLQFKTCVDQDHETRFEGMKPHGHYNVPLMDEDRVLGVMVLYIEHEHEPHPEEEIFMTMLGQTVSSFIQNRSLQAAAGIKNLRFQKAQQEIVQKLLTASEYRDNETGAHIQRMSKYAVALGRSISMDAKQLHLLELAAPMHDIGKIGIPDGILLKPGRLSEEEYTAMQAHTTIGAEILQGSHPLLVASREIALTHHERWDGKGYPRGLAGTEIPIFGRICALVDVFDALTSERPYKKAWSIEKALDYIQENSGAHFDPRLVKAFEAALPEILEIKNFFDHIGKESNSLGTHLPEHHLQDEHVSWKDCYSVGIPFIDQQHRFLISLINRIHRAIEESSSEEIAESLLEMRTYAMVHFREEENIMEEVDYPQIQGHRRQHNDFLQYTDLFLDELEDHPLAIGPEATKYLKDWLSQHIQGSDQAYAEFLEQCSQRPQTSSAHLFSR
jgi:hemerythrin-like metal-binding protein